MSKSSTDRRKRIVLPLLIASGIVFPWASTSTLHEWATAIYALGITLAASALAVVAIGRRSAS